MLSLLCLPAIGQQAPTDCSDLETGYFAYTKEPMDRFLIKRTAKKQIEMGIVSKDKMVLEIDWEGCNYYLKLVKDNDPANKELQGTTMNIAITGRDGDTYQYESFLLGQKFEGEIKRVDKKEHIQMVKEKYGK